MRRLPNANWLALLALALLVASGCGGHPKPPPAEEETPPSAAVGEMQMGGSVIRVADPEGKWKFEARSEHIEAEGIDGPYRLQPAECWYQAADGPRVFMQADHARLDKAARRVLLTGNVRVTHAAWSLVTERLDYDLAQGKVLGSGQTKLSYGGQEAERLPPSDSEVEEP